MVRQSGGDNVIRALPNYLTTTISNLWDCSCDLVTFMLFWWTSLLKQMLGDQLVVTTQCGNVDIMLETSDPMGVYRVYEPQKVPRRHWLASCSSHARVIILRKGQMERTRRLNNVRIRQLRQQKHGCIVIALISEGIMPIWWQHLEYSFVGLQAVDGKQGRYVSRTLCGVYSRTLMSLHLSEVRCMAPSGAVVLTSHRNVLLWNSDMIERISSLG